MVDFSRMRYPLVIAKPAKSEGGVEVSAYQSSNGQRILTNATARPFSPITGEPLSRIETASTIALPVDAMKNYVTVASCSNKKCGCTILAHSDVADAIEIEGNPIHCVLCATEITPDIDMDELLRAMAADNLAEDNDSADEDDFDAPTADDGPDGEQVKFVTKAGDEKPGLVDPQPDAEATEDVGDNADLPKPGAAGADENGKDDETPAKLVETVKAGSDCDDKDDKDSDEDEDNKETAHDYDGDGECDDLGDEGDDEGDDDEDDDYPDYFGDDEDADEGDDSGEDDSDDGDAPDAADSEQGDDVPADDNAEKAAITVKAAANMSVNLAATVDFKKGRLELLPSDAGYYVMHNGAPVATLLREKAAADLQDIFDKQVFANAFAAEVASGLKPENVARFGFQPITISVEVEKAMEVAMQETASVQHEELAAKNAAYVDAIRQGLSIVSVGSIKNTWDEFANPVAGSLIASLTKIGVYNPEAIVANAFAAHGAEYHQMILSKALDLADKSDEIRNETARLVDKAKARTIAPNQAEELSSILAKGGLPALARGGQKETAAAPAANVGENFSARLGLIFGKL